ncbi:MAG TPA: ATP-binding protein [Anaeromyxobacteraceae bacterium]|jgi:PAS domain S-box-containing protein|nr:ATP-binding protein [Anaeromyxobacteraceae bacterium]
MKNGLAACDPTLDLALERAAREWRDTFDAIETPIVVVEPDGRIARLNRSAQRLAGVGFEQLIGAPLRSLGEEEPWQAAAQVAGAAQVPGAKATAQVRDRSDRTWQVLANQTPGGRIIVVARDVTAAVELEASLRRAEATYDTGVLVAGVAHEVRGPLFAISATLDAAEAQLGVASEAHPYFEVLREQANRLSRTMRDLLEYGKPAALERSEGRIGEAVHGAVASCRALAAGRGVRFEERIDCAAALQLDWRRVGEALRNLLENAVQHSPAGEVVEIAAREVLGEGGLHLELTVADSGPGFGAGDPQRAFEPFFTTRGGGTGLGLSIVRRVAEVHGGEVRASNRPGGGALLRLLLPLSPRPARAHVRPAGA